MKELLDKLLQRHKYLEPTAEDELRRQVNVLYGAFTGLMGPEKNGASCREIFGIGLYPL